MNNNKSLVILDTRDPIYEFIQNCDLASFRGKVLNYNSVKQINIDLSDEKFLFHQKKKFLEIKKKYLKKIKKIFPEIDMHCLESFNLRNEKVDLYNRIFFFNKLQNLIKKKKYKFIKIYSDNIDLEKFYDSLNSNKNLLNIKIIFTSKKSDKIGSFNLSFLKFFLKTFVIVLLSKFICKNLISPFKNACLSLYPKFYSNKNETFFNEKFFKLNFLITDESHLSGTLFQNIKKLFVTRSIKNFVIVEKYISLNYLIIFFFKSFFILNKFKEINKISFFFNGLDSTKIINNYTSCSVFNALKLQIYNNQLKKIFLKHRIENFHYFMFEYNFGFFLSNSIKKFLPSVNLVGYQHGLFSDKLMWVDLFKENNKKLKIFPDKIIVKYKICLDSYKKNFKGIKILLRNKLEKKINFNISNNKKYKNKILVLLGLHDTIDTIDKIIEITKVKKKLFFFLKFHPKNKIKLKLINKNISIISDIKKIKFGSIIPSQQSTLIYDIVINKLPFKVLRINNRTNLLPDTIKHKMKFIN